jgi:hypothetical protein
MTGENFVAHLDGLGGKPVCRGTQVVHHRFILSDEASLEGMKIRRSKEILITITTPFHCIFFTESLVFPT